MRQAQPGHHFQYPRSIHAAHVSSHWDPVERTIAPRGHEFASYVALNLFPLALARELAGDEVFGGGGKGIALLPLLGLAPALKFRLWVDSYPTCRHMTRDDRKGKQDGGSC